MKKLFLFTFIFFLAFVNTVLAHTGLESSSPQNGGIIKEELQQITLTFETKVEQGSTFDLQNSKGDAIPVENISLSENQMVGDLLNPLENGEYQVIWKIIGADGHPIEGEFSFTVDLSESVTPAENKDEDEDEVAQEHDETTSENPEENVADQQIEETDEGPSPSYLIPVIIIVLIVVIVGVFFGLRRKK